MQVFPAGYWLAVILVQELLLLFQKNVSVNCDVIVIAGQVNVVKFIQFTLTASGGTVKLNLKKEYLLEAPET